MTEFRPKIEIAPKPGLPDRIDLSDNALEYLEYDCFYPCTPDGCLGHVTDLPVGFSIAGVDFEVRGYANGDFPSSDAEENNHVEAVIKRLIQAADAWQDQENLQMACCKQPRWQAQHFTDVEGRPAGGTSTGTGFTIAWQNGPLGRGEERQAPNGAFVEDIIAAAKDRLNFYQQSDFACEENAQALEYLDKALAVLNARTAAREARGVEGTHEA